MQIRSSIHLTEEFYGLIAAHQGWVVASRPRIRLGPVGVGVVEEPLPLRVDGFEQPGLLDLVEAGDQPLVEIRVKWLMGTGHQVNHSVQHVLGRP